MGSKPQRVFAQKNVALAITCALTLGACADVRTSSSDVNAASTAPQWIEANHVSLRYQLLGHGAKTVVLLHEMQMSMESWDEIIPALEPGHRLLRYDLRGFGLSEKVRGNALTIDDEVQDLKDLLDQLGITGPVTLVGGAVGGAVALKFAATYPERVTAVAVTSPAAYMKAQPERAASAAKIEQQSLRSGLDETMNAVYPAQLQTNPARVARFKGLLLANDPGSLASTTHMIYSVGFADILPKIKCPALVVATALFPRPVASFKELADAIPQGQFVVLQTGHFASLESPELVAPVLTQFLKKVGG